MEFFNMETVMLFVGVLMIAAGCWCMIRTYHLLKIIIGIEIAIKAATMFIILAGYMNGHLGLAQAYVVTVIVIEVVAAVIFAGVTVGLYKKYGNMDIRNLTQLKG